MLAACAVLLRSAFCTDGRKGDLVVHSAQIQRRSLSETRRAAARRRAHLATREGHLDQIRKKGNHRLPQTKQLTGGGGQKALPLRSLFTVHLCLLFSKHPLRGPGQ